MATNTELVQQLYVAYFNRPGDVGGVEYWTNILNKQTTTAGINTTLAAISKAFAASNEYQTTYANQSKEQVVAAIYVNLFGRPADADGLAFWVKNWNAGAYTIDTIVKEIAGGAKDTTGGFADKTAFDLKVAAAAAFTDLLEDNLDARIAYSTGSATVNAIAKAYITSVTNEATFTAAVTNLGATATSLTTPPPPAQTTTIFTTAVESLTGSAGNDTFNGTVGNEVVGGALVAAATLTALDTVNGGAGDDILNILDQATGGGTSITNIGTTSIETVNVRSAGAVNVNTAVGFSGVTALNITQGTTAAVTAAGSTAVNVNGLTGATIGVDGGSTVTVNTAVSGAAVTVGATTVSTGAVTVTSTNQAAGNIAVDGGTAVTITSTNASGGTITVGNGGAAADQPTGAVSITTTGVAVTAGTDVNLGAITVKGGSTVTVSSTATASGAVAASDTTGATVTQGAVNVNVGNTTSKTTTVSVTQSADVAEVPFVAAVAGSFETQTVTFGAMTAGQTLTINGLTFTAAKALTAAEAAAAFAGLTAGATVGTAPAGNGVYSNQLTTATATNFTSGAVVDGKVVFTSVSRTDANALTIAGTATGTSVTATTNGVGSSNATAGVLGVAAGQVNIDGQITGTDVLATVTVDGFGVGSTVKSDALTSLTLARSNNDITVSNAGASTLALSLNAVGKTSGGLNTGTVDLGTKYTTLNVTTTGTDSVVDLVASAVETLTVAGTKAVNLTAGAAGATVLSALKTVTVTGSAGLNIDASGSTVTAVNAAGTSGAVTAKIDNANATYAGGSGADALTLSSTTTTKGATLGAGDDSLILAAGTTSLTGTFDAGVGTDTLVLAAADAATASATATFATKIDGFERVSVGQVAAGAANVVDLSNLDNINYVISAGAAGAVSATAEQQTINLTTVSVANNESVTVNVAGNVVTFVNTSGLAITEAGGVLATQLVNALNANAVFSGAYTAALSGNNVVVTQKAGFESNIADIAVAGTGITGADTVTITTNTPGVAGQGSLTLNKLAANGTLELASTTTTTTTTTVNLADATGTADVLNVITKVAGSSLGFGTVNAAGVETINITATDTTTNSIQTASLTLKDAALKTVVVTGNSHLNLTLDSNVVALTSVNASALTGGLTAATNGTVAQTITSGGGADVLTATGNGNTLVAGAGNDTLNVAGNLNTLTGGAGTDTFNVGFAVSNVNAYATITDLAAGDILKFTTAAANFKNAAVTLGDTAVFQDYANAAIANTVAGDVAWFRVGGNTYVVENVAGGGTDFANGNDIIVKITGSIDLTASSFSSTADTLRIV